ncbi:Glu-tRNA(Gln) amidotransferase subunit GatD [Candidatus Woesearchaeota archaeon]|nr:Glu-tRNA(Gln) amidotransferase subunit GatD [Candidatus Woesearchaeota archaeon]
MAKAGDKVKVICKDEEIEGTLMPTEEKGTVVVKLDSGYNIGIDEKRVKQIKVLKKFSAKETKKPAVKEKKGLPVVSILHTGGTIASKVDYETGGVVAKFTPEELVEMFPELTDIANIHSRLVYNIMSENLRFSHINMIAKDIEKEAKKGVDGIIITHGTDTMHYTAAALAFILEGLSIPVILVGAQRSSDRGSSDAGVNLICAAQFIAKSDFAGVALCMHENPDDDTCVVLPGTNARKLHSSRRDAFKAVNATPIAMVTPKGKIDFAAKEYSKKSDSKLKLKLINEKIKVGIAKCHPNMLASEFKSFEGFDGLVIEGTGLGHAPIIKTDEYTKENEKILNEIKKLCKKTVAVMSSQTIFGRLQMNVYTPGREIQEAGVLGNYSDMTTETTFIKLAWLLSNYSKKETKKLITENLRGEISPCTDIRSHL